jgi:presqualene diphosphate synthase
MSVAPLAPPAATPRAPAAAGSSFYAAMRILPAEQRAAMFAIYAFCRAVDDVADRGGSKAQRLAELASWRKDVAELYAALPPPARLASLREPIQRFGLVRDDFEAIIDGMVMDTEADIRAPNWAILELYCDRVASAVGRLAVRVFGVPDAHGSPLAHHLGRALQLTNILRDLDEDALLGRLYLPIEALAAAGIAEPAPQQALAHPNIGAACATVVARARAHFTGAAQVMRRCPRATTRSPRVMASVYSSILDALQTRGFEPPRPRVRLSKPRLLWAIVRHGLR